MVTTRFVYWQDDDMWLGYLEEYPDYMTQGKSLEELKENLKDIYDDILKQEFLSLFRDIMKLTIILPNIS